MSDHTRIDENNLKDVYRRILARAWVNPVIDDDGNLDFDETVYEVSLWACDNLNFKTAFSEPLESPDDWYDFIINRCVDLRNDLESGLFRDKVYKKLKNRK